MEFRILGPLEVRDDGEPLSLAGGKQRALLADLLLHANQAVPTAQLVDDLWGERVPDTAVKALQVYVSKLRKALPGERLHTRGPGYLLEVREGELDLDVFERLATEGRSAVESGDPERGRALLGSALARWRGPALAEFFEPFAQGEAARLEELRLGCVEARIDADLALGRHAAAVPELEALVAAHPLREPLRSQLMKALYGAGRQAEALEAYQSFRRMLDAELGIEPSQWPSSTSRPSMATSTTASARSRCAPASSRRAASCVFAKGKAPAASGSSP
jgi:DNA-binding SARP family transcriptional activator